MLEVDCRDDGVGVVEDERREEDGVVEDLLLEMVSCLGCWPPCLLTLAEILAGVAVFCAILRLRCDGWNEIMDRAG